MRRTRNWILIFIACIACAPGLRAQDLKVQPTPFTVWLDFKALAASDASRPSFPIWLESLEIHSPKGADVASAKTTFRIRLRRFAGLNDEVMLRLFFDDVKEAEPAVSAWTELGTQRFPTTRLGQGLGLSTSETLAIGAAGVDYIDIDVNGDGSNVRGAFLSTLKKVEIKVPIDFAASPTLRDPFSDSPSAQPSQTDSYLFGRVKASLDSTVARLEPGSSTAYEFQLDAQPLLAVVSFEILNPELESPPEVNANSREAGPAALLLPDLADPAYQGTVLAMQKDVRFSYTGWIKCQKILPGSSLQAGLNQIVIGLGKQAGPVAIRAVELQLKYRTEGADLTAFPR